MVASSRSLRFVCVAVAAAFITFATWSDAAGQRQRATRQMPQRNVIIFVADGLRYGSVNSEDAPTFLDLRRRGVNFTNSHSLFPTFTTANASAIATGHYLGDTGDFSNTIFTGYPLFEGRSSTTRGAGSVTPFLEFDEVLKDVDDHFGGNFLHEKSMMALAREHGFNTAVLGKMGPVGVQDVSQLATAAGAPATIFIDDATGSPTGIPLPAEIVSGMEEEELSAKAPNRSNGCLQGESCDNGWSGDNTHPGTTSPNRDQQKFFADVLTRVLLPRFATSGKPFAILFWSRDPDGTQHNQGDSLNQLEPGINGRSSRAAIHNADNNLKQILSFLQANPAIAATTDVFLTSDHGYATISRHTVDAAGTPTKSYSAGFEYKSAKGELEIDRGFLPNGFVAIDLAHALKLPLFDPDTQRQGPGGEAAYMRVDPEQPASAASRQHPAAGNGLLGGTGQRLAKTDAEIVVAANGGSDLIYVPSGDKARVREVVSALLEQDYVGAIFVDDQYGAIPGTLPMSSVGLHGSATVPHPAIAVGFRTSYLNPGDLQSAIQIADTSLHQGQGMHGSFGRDNTFNNMAAFGPDFRAGYADALPVSNADIAPTLEYILGLPAAPKGTLRGRVLTEALRNGKPAAAAVRAVKISQPTSANARLVLHTQRLGTTMYFDEACMVASGEESSQKAAAKNSAGLACH